MNRPARIAAPPIPTTTPITVFRVLVLIPEEVAVLSLESWPAVPVLTALDVVGETDVTRLPDTVMTDVTIETTSEVVVSMLVSEVVGVFEVFEVLLVVFVGALVVVGVVGAEVVEGVELGDVVVGGAVVEVLLGLADVWDCEVVGVTEEVDDDDADVDGGVEVVDEDTCAFALEVLLLELASPVTALVVSSRPNRLRLNQLACPMAKNSVNTVNNCNCRRENMMMSMKVEERRECDGPSYLRFQATSQR
jgi:hypothetical protein